MAKTQTQSRGQRDNTWHAAPYQNLTVSVYLQPQALRISQQFMLTVIGSLAVRDTLLAYTHLPIYIKWPNDIYINNRKVAGLLFENRLSGDHVRTAVLGIGINVLQTDFPEDLQERAVSLKQLHPEETFSFFQIISRLQQHLANYDALLSQGRRTELLRRYNEHLYQKDEPRVYRVHGETVVGIIRGVEEDGLLQLSQNGVIKKYDLKDIVYQL